MRETGRDIALLAKRAKAHDRVAFAEIYRFAVTPVYRYFSARVNSAEEAEELTQEVFMAALSGIQGLRAEDEAGLMAWLLQIGRHKLADSLRLRYRRPASPLEEAEKWESPLPRPEDLAESEEERGELRRAVNLLTPEQREVVLCKYVLEYDNDRTARHLNRSVNAVNQLHHRALASLHRLLAGKEKATT